MTVKGATFNHMLAVARLRHNVDGKSSTKLSLLLTQERMKELSNERDYIWRVLGLPTNAGKGLRLWQRKWARLYADQVAKGEDG